MTIEQSLGIVLVVAIVVGLIRQLWVWASRPIPVTLTRIQPSTERTFPPDPSFYTRDLDRPEGPDGLWDASPEGLLRHYTTKTIEAMRKEEDAAGFARMTASLAFKLYPSMRDVSPPAEWPRKTVCPMNVRVIH